MDKLLALFAFVLSLYGCDTATRTVVQREREDGADRLYSRTVVEAGVARFECRASASGQCHYALYAGRCADARDASACDTRTAARFALAVGESRQLTGVRTFRLCVGTGRGTAAECASVGASPRPGRG